jgi:hypothetical protein
MVITGVADEWATDSAVRAEAVAGTAATATTARRAASVLVRVKSLSF